MHLMGGIHERGDGGPCGLHVLPHRREAPHRGDPRAEQDHEPQDDQSLEDDPHRAVPRPAHHGARPCGPGTHESTSVKPERVMVPHFC